MKTKIYFFNTPDHQTASTNQVINIIYQISSHKKYVLTNYIYKNIFY